MRWLVVLMLSGLITSTASAQYAVGTADVTYVDVARGGRNVPVDLYYPAVSTGAGQPVADAPASGFAAVSIGHGYLMASSVYGWLARELATIGCVVAVARTGGELFPNHQTFGLDLAFLARFLREAGDDPGSPFFGRMGAKNAVMGHSMGGGSSFLAGASDAQITALVNFAAAETNPSAIAACASSTRPVLMLAGTNDCVTPPAQHQIPMYEALGGGFRTLATIEGASHCQFADPSTVCSLGESCSASISRAEQHAMVWSLVGRWVRAMLLEEPTALAEFQQVLEGTAGLAYVQDGVPTSVEVPRPSTGSLRVLPNPFNPRTVIEYELQTSGWTSIAIVDVRGRSVRAWIEGERAAGLHRVVWDGRDERGVEVPSGVYHVRLEAAGGTRSVRAVLIR